MKRSLYKRVIERRPVARKPKDPFADLLNAIVEQAESPRHGTKILFTEWWRNWKGADPQDLKPVVLALDEEKTLRGLVVMLGNGEYDEACIESDSEDARRSVIGLLTGTGNAKWIESSPTAESCRLYRAGYDIYLQGKDGYFFVNPRPRPELFQDSDRTAYLSEFK